MSKAAHLLRLASVDDYSPVWHFTCEHDSGDQTWWYRDPDGELTKPEGADGCWFASWWDSIGAELLDLRTVDGTELRTPIPVKPGESWDYDNGGTIVLDAEAHP